MKGNRRSKLIYKVFSMLILAMTLIVICSTAIFSHAAKTVKAYMIDEIEADTGNIMREVDAVITNIYNVSDTFASEPRLAEYLEAEYGEDGRIRKQMAVNYIIKSLFAGYDLLMQNQQIGGILTFKGELFNFLDANYDDADTIMRIKEMGVESAEHLGKFHWYAVQDNFMVEREYGNIREDYVVIGSRRIYSPLRNSYPYVHIFALKEQFLYETYQAIEEKNGSRIFITGEDWQLFSATDEGFLESGEIEPQLCELLDFAEEKTTDLFYEGERYIVSVERSKVNDWKTVTMVPYSRVFQYLRNSYLQMMGVLALGLLIFLLVLWYLYRSFMNPIVKIMEHMRAVYEGDLNAYATIGGNSETEQMGRYFNAMLMSINLNVKERLESEKKKKELEMDVLMGQVNPHFLYNTLETIVWKAQEARSQEIGRIAASLGRFYRLSINDGHVITTLEREIEQLMAYVRIQKSRYGEDFSFEIRSDTEKLKNIQVLKLILQPVVENCFIYAMEDLERGLKIRMTIYRGVEELVVRVADNGNGMEKERLEEVRRQIRGEKLPGSRSRNRGSGIGLRSVQARFFVYFGLKDGVCISSREGTGTVVTIRLPLHVIESVKIDNKS